MQVTMGEGADGISDGISGACDAVAAFVEELARGRGIDPLSLRSRVGALLHVPAHAGGGRDDACLQAAAVIAATGPCREEVAMKVIGIASLVGPPGGQGRLDPYLCRKAMTGGYLMLWTAPAGGAGNAGDVVEARPGLALPGLRPGMAGMARHLTGLPKPEFDRVCGAAWRSHAYALKLLADPVAGVAAVGTVPGIPF